MGCKHFARTVTMAVLVGVAVLSPVTAAAGTPLEDAKRSGHVGERFDGYLGLVTADAPLEVQKLVEEINAKRRERYAEIAQKNGTSLEAVAAIAGKKLIERTGPGEYVMPPGEGWVRTPSD